jgi:hypothetical protein
MSDPIAKRERSLAKDARQSLAPDVGVGRPSKSKKPICLVTIEHRTIPKSVASMFWPKGWRKYATYRDLKTAETAMEGFKRKYSFYQFRIKPEVTQSEKA